MTLLILLQIPFIICVVLLIAYVDNNNRKLKIWFIIIAFISFAAAGNMGLLSIVRPSVFPGIAPNLLFWILSGYLMLMMVIIKIHIFRKIYRRSQDPDNYHYNFFGKKVVHTEVITKKEMAEFMVTIPIFLFTGSYFVARLINWIMFGQL